MKKILSLSLILVFLVLVASCNKEPINNETTKETDIIQNNKTTDLISENLSKTELSEDITDGVGGGVIESGKYRQRYYSVPYDFVILVGEEEYFRWYDEVLEYNPDRTMVVDFIQYFDISKEVFEKTNLQMAKDFVEWGEEPTLKPMDYENQQTYEIYNADILYTFDDEIINEYYLTPEWPYCAGFEYEAAVKRGEYTPRTEVWVDVEAMETEIIAKYGETEIIPEEPTDIPEVTDALPQESESTQVTEAVTT